MGTTDSEPVFKLQIVYPDGTLLRFNAGNPLEDPCSDPKCVECRIVDEVCKRGVGIFRTKAQVRKAIAEAFMALKEKTRVFVGTPPTV